MEYQKRKIKKQSGELIDFDINRLRDSLSRSGASIDEIEEIIDRIQPQIHDGISTKHIYKLAHKYLKKYSGAFAARYSLKRALRDLGPAGFYFERWIAKFLESYGYEAITNQTIQGDAVSHEADVIAKKGKELLWIECKFKNSTDAKIPVTTPMYLLSRIKDISTQTYSLFGGDYKFTQGWLVTNVYLTSDAIAFGEFYGLNMLSWNYPERKSIKTLVDQKALYPITCLTTLTKREKGYLLDQNCILISDILKNPDILHSGFINHRNTSNILKEVEGLLAID
ncbi:MAG: restriction endonuclease [Brumimicrobium sp.]|nr:restriction endonuclease [Brumimicrobium sp.]MCO5269513.1 ATP cone domain-containing protein [Brumimicrobium sp.]